MLNNKAFWNILKSIVILGWILLFMLASIGSGAFVLVARIAILVLILIHLSELTVSLPIGRENNLTTRRIVINTLVFGFTWWTPLRRGVIDE